MPRPLSLCDALRGVTSFTLAFLVAIACTGCGDNIGSVFDPDGVNPGGMAGDASGIESVPVGGFLKNGRPQVVDAFPTGSGWAPSVPVVVVFDESVALESVAPSAPDAVPAVFVRLQNTDTEVPASVDLLLGGTVVVLRPSVPLMGGMGQVYEVVVDPALADLDGVTFGGAEPRVVATFQPDVDVEDSPDGLLVTTLPVDNADDVPVEDPLIGIFDRPADPASVSVTTVGLRTRSGGIPVVGMVGFPLTSSGFGMMLPDPRFVSFTPTATLAPATDFEFDLSEQITFADGDGMLDFVGTIAGEFSTLAFGRPTAIAVANPSAGFDDAVNRNNAETLRIGVEVDATAVAGDRVRVRLYGLDGSTQAMGDLAFVEASAELPAPGAQTIEVDFTGELGTLLDPMFEDGELVLAAEVRRGSRASGYALAGGEPLFDITPPTIVTLGPPSGPTPTGQILTDLESVLLQGIASEELGQATLTDGTSTVELFASSADGRFTMRPLNVGRIGAGMSPQFTLTGTDAAGNMVLAPTQGDIVQRGGVTGALGGMLVVEAYDETTLAPIVGATVIVDPGLPAVGMPPDAGRVVAMTGADGRAFVTPPSTSHTITVVADGFDLFTLFGTSAGFASLPLTPIVPAASEGILTGIVAFDASIAPTVLVGSNVFADRRLESVATSPLLPGTVPPIAIRAGRASIFSGFSGTFEPTSTPSFLEHNCNMCGADGMTPTPSIPGVPAGTTSAPTLTLRNPPGGLITLGATFARDYSAAFGLGTLATDPMVRMVGSAAGLSGVNLLGIGFATETAAEMYTINGSFAVSEFVNLLPLGTLAWVSSSVADVDGGFVRNRRLIQNGITATPVMDALDVAVPGVPLVAAPGGPFTGSPAVTFDDRLNPGVLPASYGFSEIVATGPGGRVWRAVLQDTDTTGNDTLQLPMLTGVGVTGLLNGSWSVFVEQVLALDLAAGGFNDFFFEDRFRQQFTFARSPAMTFTIQ